MQRHGITHLRAVSEPSVGDYSDFHKQGQSESPDVNERLRGAMDSLAARQERGDAGRFIVGGLAAAKTFERSEAFWVQVEPLKCELLERATADLAADDAAETKRGLLEAWAEARLFRQSMYLRLVDGGGPITAKGRTKALYTAYLAALDRETKLAQVLGLERQQKSADIALRFAQLHTEQQS